MKKHISKICLLLLCPFFGQQLAAQSLSFTPERPLQQKKITFSYQPKGGDLEFSDNAKATMAFYSDFKWHTTNVILKRAKDNWEGEYLLPAKSAFIALRFYQGDSINPEATDNNKGMGYFSRTYLENKKDVPGSFLVEAAFHSGLTGNWSLNSFLNPVKDAAMVDSLLKKDAKFLQNNLRSVLFTYLDLKRLTMSATDFDVFADETIKNELKKGNLNEDLLAEMQRYYLKIKNTKAADLLAQQIELNYPKSGTARLLLYKKVTEEKSGENFQAAAEDYLKRFPYVEWKKNPDEKGFIYYSLYRGLAANYFESGQTEKFLSLFKDIDFKTANEIYRWNLTRGEMAGKADRKMLYGLSLKIIPYLIDHQKDGSYLIDFDHDQQKAQDNADNQMNDRLFTHIILAKDQQDYAGAIPYFKYLSKTGMYSNADLNAMHVYILEKLGDEKSVKPLLENSVAANAVTPAMFEKLKQVYMDAHNGNENGYQEYISALIPADKKNEMRIHVMSNMVDYPLIPFSLEDADGKMVHSKDWADQIVVIDFWATWCRPCIEAFPGMQLLVDQYAKDPKVAVYMIGTMQFGDYKAKSVKYVRDNHYRFNLLHDAVGAKGEQDQVFRSLTPLFKSSAIPRKIIVKNGKVRYSSEGYSGSPSQLRDELSMAIEILRAEK
ncbi:TlpA disulfide reductase family protein [Pedobacter sp. R20-19]|uniref:TlpA family protein disulfide reductase n=1 Tax=Pedobacter sp. R20-19 TaxID=1270196 RepID=UPI0004936DFB|nr:TlpA disulfide reductase family protein [Pedobacter sp. R20-19]